MPHQPIRTTPTQIHKPKFNMYLVANEAARKLLDRDYVVHALQDTIANILGRDAQPISLYLNLQTPPPI